MPVNGALEFVHNRTYRYIEPNGQEPGAWRLATPEAGTSGGGGGTGGARHDIDGIDPIKAVTTVGTVTKTEISLDIQALTPRV